ncbi:MAG: rod shape determining protein RodA [Candidatus Krumholzibacteriia bacterium]|jgi:rod shape determining protein RodA
MNFLHNMFPVGDKHIFVAWLALCLTSLAVLWSVTEPISGPYDHLDPGVSKNVFIRQAIWMVIGYVGLLTATRLPIRYIENVAVPMYLASLALLVLILLIGPKIGGAQRWLAIGSLRLQPSELAKVAFIVMNASVLARAKDSGSKFVATLLSAVVMIIPVLLILREPDLGTSLVFVAAWVGTIFWFGVPNILLLGAASAAFSAVIMFYSESVAQQAWPWGVYILLLLGGLYLVRWSILAKVVLLTINVTTGIGIPVFWDRLIGYQQERILTFFDPTRDAFGSGYQAIQSKVAIGSGGLFGTHYLQGTQKGLAFLPERHTDFIFSVVGEELGFLGTVVLLGVFLHVILRGVNIAATARQPFGRFLAIGVVTYFVFHVVVNVAITTGLMPVTGLPLPLISYGGSNLLISSILLGLLMNVSSRTFDV